MFQRLCRSSFPLIRSGSSYIHRTTYFRISTIQRMQKIGLNDDQLAYQELALDFMNSKLKPKAREWDERHEMDFSVVKEAAKLGFGALYVPTSHGGTGLSRHDTSVIFEALAQGCVSTTSFLTIHNMTAWMLSKFGSEELRKQYLPQMITCETTGSYCLTEPHSGSDAAALATTCRRVGNEYVIKGQKMFISGGGANGVYLVMARTAEHKTRGISCVLIPKDAKGLSFGAMEKKMGWHASRTTQVFFDDVRVPIKNRIGEEGEGFKIAMKGLDGGRLNIAACSLGSAQRCLEDGLKYASERKQFDQRVTDFQHTQFKIADMARKVHTSRLVLRNAAHLLDEDHDDKTMHCAMAKQFVTDTCFEVCNEALQLFGGYGYLKEFEVERFVRDCRVHQILEGTNEIMRVITWKKIWDGMELSEK